MHLQIDTYEDLGVADAEPIHRSFCQIKIFRDKVSFCRIIIIKNYSLSYVDFNHTYSVSADYRCPVGLSSGTTKQFHPVRMYKLSIFSCLYILYMHNYNIIPLVIQETLKILYEQVDNYSGPRFKPVWLKAWKSRHVMKRLQNSTILVALDSTCDENFKKVQSPQVHGLV